MRSSGEVPGHLLDVQRGPEEIPLVPSPVVLLDKEHRFDTALVWYTGAPVVATLRSTIRRQSRPTTGPLGSRIVVKTASFVVVIMNNFIIDSLIYLLVYCRLSVVSF